MDRLLTIKDRSTIYGTPERTQKEAAKKPHAACA